MTFRTSPADRKDEEKSGEGAIVPKKRCPGQARDLSVFLRWLTFGAGGRRRNPLSHSLSYELQRGRIAERPF